MNFENIFYGIAGLFALSELLWYINFFKNYEFRWFSLINDVANTAVKAAFGWWTFESIYQTAVGQNQLYQMLLQIASALQGG